MTTLLAALWIGTGFCAEGLSPKMQQLKPALQELLVDLSSSDFMSGKNSARVEKRATQIAELAHAVQKMKASESKDADPSLAIFAGEFSADFKRAVGDLKRGNRAYARERLQAATQYCIACHSRSSSGPSFPGVSAPELKGMTSLQKSEFLMATRQYDAALGSIEEMIAQPEITNVFDWERALGLGLTLAVRVKQEPAVAERITAQTLKKPRLPAFIKTRAEGWMNSIEQWKGDVKDLKTDAGVYAEIVRLFTRAKTNQQYPADRSADVDFLRATALMHRFLKDYPNHKDTAEVLFLLGTSYSVLRGLGIWDLGEKYFVACIKTSPHSAIAQKCFLQFQESIYAGYTGTQGTTIPNDEQHRLDELESLARPS